MAALRELFAVFGIKFDDKELKEGAKATDKATKELNQLGKVSDGVSNAIKGMAVAFAGFASVSGITQLITSTMESSNQLGRWSQRLQVSTSDIASFSAVAAQHGADVEDVADSYNDLRIKARDALDGTKTYQDIFKIIGISQEELQANVNDTNGLMELFTQRLMEGTDAATQHFVADELLSDVGVRMLPVFRMGSKALKEQREAFVKNNKATLDAVEATRQLNPHIAKMNQAWQDTKASIFLALAPSLGRAISFGTKMVRGLVDLAKNTELVRASFIVLGGVAVGAAALTIGAWGPVVGAIGLFVLGVGAAILLLDDFIVTIQGGESATKKLVDSLLGIGTTKKVIEDVKQAWQDWAMVIDTVANALEKVNLYVGGALGISTVAETDVSTEKGLSQARTIESGRRAGEALIPSFIRSGRGKQIEEQARARRAPQIQRAMAGSFEREFFPELSPYGQQTVMPPEGPSQTTTIEAPMNVEVNISEATDARQVDGIVRAAITEERDRTLRSIRGATARER